MHYLGIDIGTSAVKLAAVDEDGALASIVRRAHQGSPIECVRDMLDEWMGEPPAERDGRNAPSDAVFSNVAAGNGGHAPSGAASGGLGACGGFVITGSGADQVRDRAGEVPALEDVPALVRGVRLLAPEAASAVQMGAQSALYVTGLAGGGAPRFAMNESCAAGTGSFFEDQMERLGLPLEDYSRLVAEAASVPRLSGRCSVFAKTDIIHRQQEGVPVADILQGLCHATVKAFKAIIVRGLPVERPVALAGGTLLNAGVVRAVRDVFDLKEGELLCDPALACAQAVGAADEARERACRASGAAGAAGRIEDSRVSGAAPSLALLRSALADARKGDADGLARLDPLPKEDCAPHRGFSLAPSPWNLEGTPAREGAETPSHSRPFAPANGPVPCALGIDVGSTSTNLVLLTIEGELVDAQYLRTRGNPKKAVREGLAVLRRRAGDHARVVAVGVTGSGRSLIGRMVGADAVRDEITAQARAAVAADAQADTVFEIGGQDSKYIGLARGQVADFQMNKVCAAGTGSFVEEQAGRLGIALADYGPFALSSAAPVDLGERCTVFVETALHAALAQGATKADVAAGLAYSVVRNYLHKVVGAKPVGKRIVLQGGVAYNPAIVAAFRACAGDALTVSPWFAVSGAVGAAFLALEAQGVGANVEAARADGLRAGGMTVADAAFGAGAPAADGASSAGFPGHLPISAFKGWDLSGASHERPAIDPAQIAANRAFFRKTDELYLEGYDPARDPSRKTVGVPRCLMMHKLFPMANAFFKALGFNVVLTDASDEETVRLAQLSAQGETCYPVKLVHGHMAQLAEMDVDYVFMPSVHTIRHAKSSAPHNYACPYMQSIPAIVARELRYEERGITLLNPLLNMDFGQGAMAEAMLDVGARLGRSPQETARAMLAGGFAVSEFTRKTEALGDELLAGLAPGERVMVVITRNYGIVDPALNMGIPDLLLDRGQKVVTVSHLHAHDLGLDADYASMYWPFGQHILSGAKLVRRDPRLFAVYLTNHGCGPDTMVSRLFAREMGDKPYLQIEVDEHYSKVGVETRIEAFLNAIERYEAPDERDVPTSTRVVNLEVEPLRLDEPAALPSYGPYGRLVASWLRARGAVDVRLMATGAEALERGRQETNSKEYCTFTSLLGASLIAAQEGCEAREGCEALGVRKGRGAQGVPDARDAHGRLQLLLPSSQGGEADGQYARVVRSVLDEKGHDDVRVLAPSLELLPCTSDDPQGLFLRMLAGDVFWAAAPDARDGLLARLVAPSLTLDDVLDAAAVAHASWQAEKTETGAGAGAGVGVEARMGAEQAAGAPRETAIALVGEWPLVAGDELSGGTWMRLERKGYRILRQPLSEYLWFLWQDGRVEAAHEKVIGGPMPLAGESAEPVAAGLPDAPACAGHAVHAHVPVEADAAVRAHPLFGAKERTLPQDEWVDLLEGMARCMRAVHDALGDASPFAPDPQGLLSSADEGMGGFRGANGRYRWAKAAQMGHVARGVVAAASSYENTDTVLRLGKPPTSGPLLHLAFDGVLDQGIEERLRSFLYYV